LLHIYNRHDHDHDHDHDDDHHHHHIIIIITLKIATPSEQFVEWGGNINFIFMMMLLMMIIIMMMIMVMMMMMMLMMMMMMNNVHFDIPLLANFKKCNPSTIQARCNVRVAPNNFKYAKVNSHPSRHNGARRLPS